MVRTYLFCWTASEKHRDIVISTLIITVAQTSPGFTTCAANPGKGIPSVIIRTVIIRSHGATGWDGGSGLFRHQLQHAEDRFLIQHPDVGDTGTSEIPAEGVLEDGDVHSQPAAQDDRAGEIYLVQYL